LPGNTIKLRKNWQYTESSPQVINAATLPCKIKRSPSRYTATPKGTKFRTKNKSLLVHIVELSAAVAKVDIKVINAS